MSDIHVGEKEVTRISPCFCKVKNNKILFSFIQQVELSTKLFAITHSNKIEVLTYGYFADKI